ncbi:hypothetical protein LJPFL01_3751 [Lelliottia jeotgali]|nr:hypothetical protein LJPFL01_3751 [Lelliottia jeotgali]
MKPFVTHVRCCGDFVLILRYYGFDTSKIILKRDTAGFFNLSDVFDDSRE